MRPSDAGLDPARTAITQRVTAALRPLPGLRSVTFAGSFVDREDWSGISDIDTIVVVERLTPACFSAAVEAVTALTGADLGFPGRTVRVNPTLGPLKFDGPANVVVHLMLYDRASHRDHVIQSPFTCLDWERSTQVDGTPLPALYPARALQPNDFLASRRGLANFMDDLDSGSISVRLLEPSGDRMVERTTRVALDARHTGEYAYHITHNLIANALKMRTGTNTAWEPHDLEHAWTAALPDLAEWLPFYRQLRDLKQARSGTFPPDTLARTRAFVDAFSSSLHRAIAAAPMVRLVRHARTTLNDGTFLGSRRDPAVADADEIHPLDGTWDTVYASPLTRALETARKLVPAAAVTIDARLAEIDYGLAEGLTADQVRAHFPDVRTAWDNDRDVRFPEGEDSEQVLARVESFLSSLEAGRTLAVTHNVVMRVIATRLLGLDVRGAHRLRIGHLESLDLVRLGGRWLPQWGHDRNVALVDDYCGWQAS